MEIRSTGGKLYRTQTTVERPSEKEPSAGNTPSRTDRLTLSRQAVAALEEQNSRRWEEANRAAEKADEGKSALDLLSKAMKAMKQCEEIARRIMIGDKVPPEDEAFLMENDPAGYKLALAMRREKKDPEEWESVLDDEDRSVQAASDTAEGSGAGESSNAAETASSGSGGGAAAE